MFSCEYCSAEFYDEDDCDEHKSDERHWTCDTCDKTFGSFNAANAHMTAKGHRAVSAASSEYSSEFSSEASPEDFECETCDSTFGSERAAEQHMDAKGHWANYCQPCGQKFQSQNNLKMVAGV